MGGKHQAHQTFTMWSDCSKVFSRENYAKAGGSARAGILAFILVKKLSQDMFLMPACLSVSVFLSVRLFVCLSLCIYIMSLFIYLIYLCIFVCSVYVFIYLFIYSFVHLDKCICFSDTIR